MATFNKKSSALRLFYETDSALKTWQNNPNETIYVYFVGNQENKP